MRARRAKPRSSGEREPGNRVSPCQLGFGDAPTLVFPCPGAVLPELGFRRHLSGGGKSELGTVTRLELTLAGFAWAGSMTSAGPVVEWTRLQPFPTAAQARTLMYDGEAVVAVCDGGVILHHAPAGNWQRAATPTTNELRSGLFATDRFVAAGDGGTIATSDDGLVWQTQVTGTGANLVAVVAAGSNLFALGEGGALLRSTDGLAWSLQPTPTSQTLRAAAYGAET